MKLYIRSAACISPQKTFQQVGFLDEVIEYTGTRLKAIEPDYTQFIDVRAARRMSHVIKMGVAAAQQCLLSADIQMPGAIITGTAFGCMEDTVSFLTRVVEMNEEMLPPTAFIQSTHNTVAAQIALMLKCHSYNNTFVHKGISFESAVFDAMLLLKEGEADNILVGGTEEMVDTSFRVLTRLGLYKRQPISNLELFGTRSKGTIGGEGAAFFLLSDKPSADNMAELIGLRTFYGENTDIENRIFGFLKENGLKIDDIDLIVTGKNGDTLNDEAYDFTLLQNKHIANYKHLSGEYPVSSSFALWVASNIIAKGTVPEILKEGKFELNSPKRVLIYNHYQNKYHSLMLLAAC